MEQEMNAELCGVWKDAKERLSTILRWFGYVERMENSCIVKAVYGGNFTEVDQFMMKGKVDFASLYL